MAQEVRLMGATYSAVPSVLLPDSNGTYHSFIDTSDATATASEILSGYTAYSNGTKLTGTASGGSSSAERSDVNFYDYDGTLLHSYTASDASALTALPDNPSHEGLTSQGWNYTLAQIKAEVTDHGKCDVGQMYVTDDDTIRLYCTFEEGRLEPYLGICPSGTVVVDWGDGSATDTIVGTSVSVVEGASHTYTTAGDYTITLTVTSGRVSFRGTSYTSYILRKSSNTSNNINKVYSSAIKRIELGSKAMIDEYAFNYCSCLESITIPSSVTSIGNYAFYYCYALKNVIVPSGLTNIGNYAFYNCYALKNFAFSLSVTTAGNNMFYNCTSLENVVIPSGLTGIESSMFRQCTSLTDVVLPNGLVNINGYAFDSCYSLKNINIPNGVTSIANYAFNYCYALKNINIPNGITSITSNAFYGCHSFTKITIPSAVTSIGSSAFRNCYAITSVTISSAVTSISASAFNSCYGVAEYHIEATTPPTLANTNAFYNIQSDCKIYVPSGTLSAYQSASNWSTYASYMAEE